MIKNLESKKNLVQCCKALFLAFDSNVFIQQYLSGMPITLPDEAFIKYQRHNTTGTLDQFRSLLQLLRTEWEVKPTLQSSNLQFCDYTSIFNTLLHFVEKDLLTIQNGKVICDFRAILEWHNLTTYIGEDVLISAFLSAHDLKHNINPSQRDFQWEPYIQTNDYLLNYILDKPLGDIHAHLKGSSFNFDINWMCLMNHIDHRQENFKSFKKYTQSDNRHESNTSLYLKALQAAAIRLYLMQENINANIIALDQIENILRVTNNDISNKCNNLQQKIALAQELYGKRYTDNTETVIYDYLISDSSGVANSSDSCDYSLLSGERKLLYYSLRHVYSEDQNSIYPTLLYIYLLIKNEFRQELSQTNQALGFGNFDRYEKRKEIFINDFYEYKKALTHLSVASFFKNDEQALKRYHETRITPKKSSEELAASITTINEDIYSPLFYNGKKGWNVKYIIHFIKGKDETSKNLTIDSTIQCRHYSLREDLKTYSKAICDFRNNIDWKNIIGQVVGIDAANSEILCRPEVFSQAFRFLRHHKINHPQLLNPEDLGITFHVGEDFLDIVDGLRAIDEAIHFLKLQKGDRIGHGLALGIDVKRYYHLRNMTIAMPLQLQMDNCAWLYNRLKRHNCSISILDKVKGEFDSCFRLIYQDGPNTKDLIPDIRLYYTSMLLRGDNPNQYESPGKVKTVIENLEDWNLKAFNDTDEANKARKIEKACKLYFLYHFDPQSRFKGQTYREFKFDEDMLEAISKEQAYMLEEIEDLGLCIECNPTSNLKIGDINSYSEHPITRFNNQGLNIEPKHIISTSLNTDDKGIFSTSIEREYALIAHSMIQYYSKEKQQCTERDIYNWINDIRCNTLEQRFDKKLSIPSEAPESSISEAIEDLRKEERDNMEKELQNKSIVERMKYCYKILFSHKNQKGK